MRIPKLDTFYRVNTATLKTSDQRTLTMLTFYFEASPDLTITLFCSGSHLNNTPLSSLTPRQRKKVGAALAGLLTRLGVTVSS